MANSNYEEKIVDAIETIVQNAVKKAGYDRTIQCIIIECVDQTMGKYKVKYQDSSFMAYSGSSDMNAVPLFFINNFFITIADINIIAIAKK